MSKPHDKDTVLDALRLGWAVAEVRGRNRPESPSPGPVTVLSRSNQDLPLRFERSDTELRIEAQTTLMRLARELGVDEEPPALREGGDDKEGAPASRAAHIDSLARQLDHLRCTRGAVRDEDLEDQWTKLAHLIYLFDAHAQDELAARNESEACAYQLGRGLAEAFWALEVEPPEDEGQPLQPCDWRFLLGDARTKELSRMVGRLSPYLNSFTPPAVSASLGAWAQVAGNQAWRTRGDAHDSLYAQTRRWYELLILEQDPSTLTRPYAMLRNSKVLVAALKAFWFQIVVILVTLTGLIVLIYLLATGDDDGTGKVVAGAVSVIGLSAASVATSLKNQGQAVAKRIRQDALTDLIGVEATIVPTYANQTKLVRKAVEARTLTTGIGA